MQTLAHLLSRVAAGRAQALVLHAAAGTGKTTHPDDLAAAARERPRLLATGNEARLDTTYARHAALQVVVDAAGALPPAVAEDVVQLGAGNPLALVELSLGLTAAQRAGSERLERAVPAGGRLTSLLAARIGRLAPAPRRLLEVA